MWLYIPKSSYAPDASDFKIRQCPFCSTLLQSERRRVDPTPYASKNDRASRDTTVCPACGFWQVHQWGLEILDGFSYREYESGATGTLRQFDPTDISAPLDEVRTFLTANYESRYSIAPPTRYEDVVRDVFRNLGYQPVARAEETDGGIDVVMSDSSGVQVGVQVKRWRGSIKAGQIRELHGALNLKGITKGIFVTTSEFQRGAVQAAAASASLGIPIELYDAKRFFEQLRIAQLTRPWSFEDLEAPFRDPELTAYNAYFGSVPDGDAHL